MNNSYFSPAINNYSTSYDYSFEYSSPSTYFYSPLLPTACPVHLPHIYYPTTSSSMNISPLSYNYYQQPPQSQVYSPPPVQQQITGLSGADRTPLRRHKCFKRNELQILHQAYNRDSHPSTDVLQQLAIQLKAPIDKVRQWFKNRRHSDKQKQRGIPTGRTSTTN